MQKLTFILILALFASCTSNEAIESVNEVPDADAPVVEFLSSNSSLFEESGFTWGEEKAEAAELIGTFYKEREYRPAWTSAQAPGPNALVLDSLLHRAHYYGLDTTFYRLDKIDALEEEMAAARDQELLNVVARYEFLLTNEAFLFMSHLNQGRLDPDSFWVEDKLDKVTKDLAPLLLEGVQKNEVKDYVLKAQPDFYEYHRLIEGLAFYLDSFELNQDTFYVHNGKKDSAKASADAHEVLVACGFLTEEEAKDDSLYMKALKSYQELHGMHPDGKIGRNTRRVLTMNNEDRYYSAVASLQRLRWENDTSPHYLYINIPSYQLKIVENNEERKSFKVVVGTAWNKTPTLTARMKHFILNPKWFVPYSISTTEIMPKAQKDSTYLKRNGYKVYQGQTAVGTQNIDWSQVKAGKYKIRQAAGRGNALGRVKFIFPNPHNVYVHDTNQKRFFKKDVRSYSHGCMRLENPFELADYIVEYEKHIITPDSIDTLIDNRIRKTVKLTTPLDVKVRYVTASGDTDGKITFYLDVYKMDEKLITAWKNIQTPDPRI